MQEWQYPLHSSELVKIIIQNFKDEDEFKPVFIAACCDIGSKVSEKGSQEVLNKLEAFKDIFLPTLKELLSQHSAADHKIKLLKNQESPFRPLYNLLKKELYVFKEYIDQTLNKGWI